MTLAAYSHALAAAAYSVFALSLLRGGLAQRNNTPAQLSFTAAIVASAAWAWAGLAAELRADLALVIVGGVLDLARYLAWFVFAFVLLRPQGARSRARTIVLIGLGATALGAIGLLVAAGALGPDRPGGLARNVPLASLALPVIGLVLVEQLFRNAAEASRWHTKPLCLGLACIFLFDIYLHSNVLLFGQFDADSVTIRSTVHAIPVALFYVASKRHADWSRSFQVSRDAAFHTATLMLVGGYLLVISAIGYYVRHVGGDWGGALGLALLCIGLTLLALLVFSGTLRAKLRVFVGKNFFRYRYDYRNEWLRFTSRLAADNSPREVGGLVVRGLAEMMHSPSGALWHRDSDGAQLVQAARWNAPRSAASEPVDSPFVRFMQAREWIVDLDEYRAHPDRYEGAEPPAWLTGDPQHWLAVPLIVGGQLTGMVVIDRPHAVLQVNWEVRDLLKTASRQAASFLALMHATDALLEARKFDAFNKMSAFVVHDLKNIVAQLSLMMQNARRLKDNAEFQEDMLTTVENSLEKMRRMMLQLRSGETPAGTSAGVALAAVIERIRASALARGRSIEVQVVDRVVTRGHEERVERVLGHLVDNAFDASKPADTIAVTLSRESSQAKIVVRDNGQGMSAEFLNNRLFKPFDSTKANGMGIGAYESRQYIQEIGGSLAVESELGRGTVVTVRLPLLEVVVEGSTAWRDWEVHTRDGRVLTMAWSNVRLPDGRVIGMGTDVTAVRAAEDAEARIAGQLQQAQKLESLGLLAGGIAHDFNNLLVGVLGNASLAEEMLPAGSDAAHLVTEVRAAATRAADLTRQLLAYAGKGRFVVEPVDVSLLAGEMAALLRAATSKQAILRQNLTPGLPAVEADATQLRQVVMNLITNASDALGESPGTITLRTSLCTPDERERNAVVGGTPLTPGRYVCVEVTDTGSGMSAETLSRIFDPFFTTKRSGHGLGLAATLGIIRSHRGGISLRSALGHGTDIRVYLPALERTARPSPTPNVGDVRALRGEGEVLLADDEPAVRAVAARALERSGFCVTQCKDGAEALAVFTADPARWRTVVLDLTMPNLGGQEALLAMRLVRADIPAVLCSGYASEELNAKVTSLGAVTFVEKPFTVVRLMTAVLEVVQEG